MIIRSSRIRNQVRLLALAGLVGIVAGVGAIVFYVATRAAERYAWVWLQATAPSHGLAVNRRWNGCPRWIIRFVCGSC